MSSLKRYFKANGYTVSITSITQQTKKYDKAFDIKFADNQPIAEVVCQQIQSQFPEFSKQNTPTRIYLPDDALVAILPLFSAVKPAEKAPSEAKNTAAKSEKVNASTPAELPKRRTNKQAIEDNKKVLELLQAPDFDTRILTSEERTILENYSGAGGQYTDDATSSHNEDALTQFYTPAFAGVQMYEIAYSLGLPKDGQILEPSCGVGRLIKPAADYKNVTAFEVSEIPYRIAKKLYPDADIHNLYFEQAFLQQPRYNTPIKNAGTWLPEFDLVIGNPPYGKHSNMYQGFFGKPNFSQIEMFFMYYGLRLLKPGGLLMYVTNSSFMRTGAAYQTAKEAIFSIGKFVDAYRMPGQFMELTDVSSDVLIFRKK
jgi:hypothetical protein